MEERTESLLKEIRERAPGDVEEVQLAENVSKYGLTFSNRGRLLPAYRQGGLFP